MLDKRYFPRQGKLDYDTFCDQIHDGINCYDDLIWREVYKVARAENWTVNKFLNELRYQFIRCKLVVGEPGLPLHESQWIRLKD